MTPAPDYDVEESRRLLLGERRLRLVEAARALGLRISIDQLRRWVRQGILAALRQSGEYLTSERALRDAWLARSRPGRRRQGLATTLPALPAGVARSTPASRAAAKAVLDAIYRRPGGSRQGASRDDDEGIRGGHAREVAAP